MFAIPAAPARSHADDHAAPFQRAKSEPDRDHGFASYHVCARQDREAFDNIIIVVHALDI
jgi:hypothetical protein